MKQSTNYYFAICTDICQTVNFPQAAEKVGVSQRQLHRWRQKPEFHAIVNKALENIRGELPAVFSANLKAAKKGNVKQIELIYKLLGMLIDRHEVEQTVKDKRFRMVPIGKATVKAVQSWLKSRKDFSSTDYLFTTQRADRMTDRGVQHLFQVLNERTGIEVTPHKCRHTFAKQLADKTGKLEVVADLCGHKSIETTRIYTTPSMKELKKAVEAVEFDG